MRYSYVSSAPTSAPTTPAAVMAPSVVLDPSHEVPPETVGVPPAARVLLARVLARGERRAQLHLSRAYWFKKTMMTTAVSLRTYDLATGEPLGWGMWVNDKPAGGMVFGPKPRPCTMTDFQRDVLGLPPLEVERRHCPACDAEVRVKADGELYKHKGCSDGN